VFWQRDAIWQQGYDARSQEIQVAVAEQNTVEAVKQGVADTAINQLKAKHEQDKLIIAKALKSVSQERDSLRAAIDHAVRVRTLEAGATTGGEAGQSAATNAGVDDTAARFGVLLDQCAGRLENMAGSAEQHAKQVRGLQAWVKAAEAVCVAE
jgi:hypothetical protein